MSKDKLPYAIPAAFSLAVRNDVAAVAAYARLVTEANSPQGMDAVVRDVLEGETRALAANLSIEDVFSGRATFLGEVQAAVAGVLGQYGVTVLNANVRELMDSPGSDYFASQSQRISAEARNSALADVAAADKRGRVAEAERLGETRARVAEVEATARKAEGAAEQAVLQTSADVDSTRARTLLQSESARISGEQSALELLEQRGLAVELERAKREKERARATLLSQATVEAELQTVAAEGEASAVRLRADAELHAARARAEAVAFAGECEGAAQRSLLEAQAAGMQAIVTACGGDPSAALNYLALVRGEYREIAKSTAAAVAGMQPKITVWAPDAASGMAPVASIARSLPPLLDTIRDQTGFSLPSWAIQTAPSPPPEPAAPAAPAAAAAELPAAASTAVVELGDDRTAAAKAA